MQLQNKRNDNDQYFFFNHKMEYDKNAGLITDHHIL